MVARKHGISRGQFYAWRQQLLLRVALGDGADTIPSSAGVDVTTTAPRLEPAIPAPPESASPATAAALVLPVQPDGQVGTTGRLRIAPGLDKMVYGKSSGWMVDSSPCMTLRAIFSICCQTTAGTPGAA